MKFLCHTTDIPENSSKGFELPQGSLAVIHKNGQFYAYLNHCPHRGIRLEWEEDQFLDYDRHFIQCATHGALFRIEDGECIAGPCPGEKLSSVELIVDGGRVLVNLPDSE